MTTLTNIPAIDCALSGGYLIEASAGTGKTWTLTGIILRLLVEKNYAPERMIATTFTRAAAREMQERIQDRISSFYRYIYWLNGQKANHGDWFDGDDKEISKTWQEIKDQARMAGIHDHDDPINEYLIKQLICGHDPNAFTLVIRRCSLLLAMLDKLFVGTLDSLAQKWLKEFSDQIGYQMNTTISANSDELTYALIHDALRREHVRVAQSPKLYALIGKDIFSDVQSVYKEVALALNFYDAPIDQAVAVDDVYLMSLDKKLMSIFEVDLSVFEPFYDYNYAVDFGFSKSIKVVKQFGLLKNIIEMIKIHRLGFVNHLNKDEKDFLGNELLKIKKEGNFKKGFDENKALFFALPIDGLLMIGEVFAHLQQLPDYYQSYLYASIANDIRIQLKTMLESQHKSTFTFQMVRLIEALERSPELARHIRHHYPVALIDESQDINGLQRRLIELIYLDYFKERRDKGKKATGFLLLVGDPKQAIYRFRGGDVVNYNSIKHFGQTDTLPPLLNSNLTLNINRRSNGELIDALNHWFARQNHEMGFNPAYLGDGIDYQHIIAYKKNNLLSWQHSEVSRQSDYLGDKPFTLLHLPYADIDDDGNSKKVNAAEYVARHINSLLQGGHSLDGRMIMPEDIAVLSRTKKDLTKLKKAFDKLGIPSISPNEINVFTTKSAKDLYALLTAMVNQERELIGRLLITKLFGYELEEVATLLNDETLVETVVFYLKKCHERFLKYGITSALTYALLHHPLSEENLWQTAARTGGERYLVDLWQLTELIGREYTYQENNEIKLLHWFADKMTGEDDNDDYQQMILPSESGIHLMTIHKSKGLEFPIVYVMGLDSPSSTKDKDVFYAYSDERFRRRISPTKDKHEQAEIILDYYKKQQNKELLDERLRLGYVALTRASEQTFVVGQDLFSDSKLNERPLFLWLERTDKILALPERLTGKVDMITPTESEDLMTSKYHRADSMLEPIHYDDWQTVFTKTDFLGASKTSATALMSAFHKPVAMNDDHVIDDEVNITHVLAGVDDVIDYPDHDIRPLFEKGVNAGTFLHRLLQLINPNDVNDISQRIIEQVRQLNFAHAYAYHNKVIDDNMNDEVNDEPNINHHQSLINWLYDISHTPMLSSGVSLSQLAPNRVAKEMSFTLRLTERFSIDKLNQVFKAYSDKDIVLNEQHMATYYKYLNGEIDLVYEHDGKFYVVDYKSNFIGARLSDYCQENLALAMNKAGYWLQACVYQVALHRLLKIRIKDYVGHEQCYLGAVEFIFVRGVDKDHPVMGHICWQVPLPLIHALDELFG